MPSGPLRRGVSPALGRSGFPTATGPPQAASAALVACLRLLKRLCFASRERVQSSAGGGTRAGPLVWCSIRRLFRGAIPMRMQIFRTKSLDRIVEDAETSTEARLKTRSFYSSGAARIERILPAEEGVSHSGKRISRGDTDIDAKDGMSRTVS